VRFTASASDADGQVVGYRWNFGNGQSSTSQSPSHTYQSGGSFTAVVTVTDNAGATASASIIINVNSGTSNTTQNVAWKNAVGVSVSGNSLVKTAGAAWGNGGASSVQRIESSNGYLQFTATETNLERICGLAASDTDQHYNSIDYAVHLNTGRAFYVVERGVSRGYFGDYNSGDVFRISVESGAVKYSRNGAVFYTSTLAPSFPLMADASLLATGATITDAVISGEAAGGPVPITPPFVKVLTPTAGEQLKSGSVYNITWIVRGTGVWRQDIQVTYDGGLTWRDLAVMFPGDATSYAWTVPSKKTKAARIRIIAYAGGELSGQGTSDGRFIINKTKLRAKK
jgi:hypothetical protein